MQQIPKHIAIIMDGNGRWAKKRFLPRIYGHVKGVSTLKKIIQHANEIGIKYLTVFAFGRENWQRPEAETSFLMKLMLRKLNQEIEELNAKNAKICFIGDTKRLNDQLIASINLAQTSTHNNNGLHFNICLDYSGQYDILQAINRIIADKIVPPINEEILSRYLLTHNAPNPELIIRTGNESRLSNFLLWQSAYSEIYFSQLMWPEFSPQELDQAVHWYQNRERRFGKTSEQIES